MKKILLVCYGGGHCRIIYKIYVKLKLNNNLEISILACTTAIPFFQKLNIKIFTFKDFLYINKKKALHYGNILKSRYHNEISGINVDESIAYLGLSFYDLTKKYSVISSYKRMIKYGRHAFNQTYILNIIINKINPVAIISTNSPKAEKSAISIGNSLSIPTMQISDLFSTNELFTLNAKKICCFSNESKTNLISKGICENKIIVTGNPVFDDIKYSKRKKPYKNILWGSNIKICEKDIKLLNHIICNLTDSQLYIRFHPSVEYCSNYKLVLDMIRENNIINATHYDELELISRIDVSYSGPSTIALSCVLSGCIVYIYNNSDLQNVLPLVEYGYCEGLKVFNNFTISYDYIDNYNIDIEKLISHKNNNATQSICVEIENMI